LQSKSNLYDLLGIEEVFTPEESPIHRFYRIKSIAERCKRCRLHSTRTQVVFGFGNIASGVMVIGEAPGGNEDIYGKPFIGKAGERFSSILKEYGIERDRDFYITNVVKCRPPKNRDPQKDEIQACEPFLVAQIKIIKPKLFLALGRYSAAWLLGLKREPSMKEIRGKILVSKFNVPLIVTYHPSTVDHARNPEWRNFALNAIREDLKLFAEKIKEIQQS